MSHSDKFRKTFNKAFTFRFYLFKQLPAAFFSGIKLIEITEEKAVVTVPFKFLTKNPFRSVYFASQAMAAEMSTGVLALSNVYGRKPAVSMLIFDMNAKFHKKAVSKITFICDEGYKLKNAVEKSIQSNEGVIVTVKSIGRDMQGNIVSEFDFTWTFKQKKTEAF